MNIELLPLDIAWMKFNFFAWFSALSVVIVYIVIRIEADIKHKPLTLFPVLLKCAFLPVIFLTTGYQSHLNRFYAVEWGDSAHTAKLHMVYPKGRYIEIHPIGTRYIYDKSSCGVAIITAREKYKSVLTRKKEHCKVIIEHLSP